MAKERSDQELIKEIKFGDSQAYEELVSRYSEKAYNLALRLTRNQEDAEEVLQDVFVAVYRKIGGFEGKSSFSSWLYRVTLNASLMKLRKNKQNHSVAIEDVLPQINLSIAELNAQQSEVDREAARNQLIHAIQDAISKLPDEYRPVFILRDVDGMTSREVGKLLDLTVPAVKSRLHRSRMMLRRKLARFFREYSGYDHLDRSVGNF